MADGTPGTDPLNGDDAARGRHSPRGSRKRNLAFTRGDTVVVMPIASASFSVNRHFKNQRTSVLAALAKQRLAREVRAALESGSSALRLQSRYGALHSQAMAFSEPEGQPAIPGASALTVYRYRRDGKPDLAVVTADVAEANLFTVHGVSDDRLGDVVAEGAFTPRATAVAQRSQFEA